MYVDRHAQLEQYCRKIFPEASITSMESLPRDLTPCHNFQVILIHIGNTSDHTQIERGKIGDYNICYSGGVEFTKVQEYESNIFYSPLSELEEALLYVRDKIN